MNELAPDAVGAVSIGAVLLAELGFVIRRNVCFYHQLALSVGEGTLVSPLTGAVHYEVLAHFGPEFVHVGGRGREA